MPFYLYNLHFPFTSVLKTFHMATITDVTCTPLPPRGGQLFQSSSLLLGPLFIYQEQLESCCQRKTFLTNLYQIRNNTFFQPSVKGAACVTFHTASSAILKAFLENQNEANTLAMSKKYFLSFFVFFFSFLSLLCFLPLMWWKGQYFLPIETPSVQREAPPCSPLLCYNLFMQAADNFCP